MGKIATLIGLGPLLVTSCLADSWPLVTMRHSTETTFAPKRLREIVAIDARNRGCWDEYWLGESVACKQEEMTRRARQVGDFAPLCAAERPLSAERGGLDELVVALPDIGAWELATVVLAKTAADAEVRSNRDD